MRLLSIFLDRSQPPRVYRPRLSANLSALIGGQTTAESALPKIEDVIQEVKGWFNGRDGRWLLVFDSADAIGDEEEDDPWLDLAKYLPDSPGTHIIITTRNSSAKDITASHPIEVGKMEVLEAVDLFFKCAGLKDRSQESEVEEIVEELGILALAVNLAGHYTSKTPRLGGDLRKYLPEYRQRRKQLLGQKPKKLIHQYRESVLTTWEASFSAVERRSATAARLLLLLAFLSYDDIFTDLFCGDTGSDERRTLDVTRSTSTWQSTVSPEDAIDLYTIEACMRMLQEYSLIQWRQDQQSYAMHKLVHAWGSDRLSAEEQRRFSRAALQLLAGAVSVRQADLEYRTRLVLQVSTNFAAISKAYIVIDASDSSILDLLSKPSGFLQAMGRYWEAQVVRVFLVKWYRATSGEEHPDTISAMSNLVIILDAQGKVDEAATMQQEVLEKMRRILGEEHPNTITAMSNLAITLHDQDKLDETATMRRILGEEHPNTISAINNLANTLRAKGKVDGAATCGRRCWSRDDGSSAKSTLTQSE